MRLAAKIFLILLWVLMIFTYISDPGPIMFMGVAIICGLTLPAAIIVFRKPRNLRPKVFQCKFYGNICQVDPCDPAHCEHYEAK
jgi:hypothetical protein